MKKLITLFLSFIFLWWCGFLVFAWQINNYPHDIEDHTQAIIALTGGRNRIAEAIKLLNDGKADMLFISGVGKQSSLKAIQKRNRISITAENRVFIGKEATNTVENAIETKAWIHNNKITSIRLVTSNYHIPRSITEFKTLNPGLKIVVHPVYSELVEKKWWTSWHTFSLIFSEYNKFLYVYIRSNLQFWRN